LVFEPLEFLEKLAALIPRSRVNLVLYHGVLAPHARWRPSVVAAPRADIPALDTPTPPSPADDARPAPRACSRHWAWARLMQRAFDVDVLACPRCGGRLRLVATVNDAHVIHEILAHLGLPTKVPHADPPRPPPPAQTGNLLADVLA